MKHIVREIKYKSLGSHIRVANAMYDCGWRFTKPHRRPTNIDTMLRGIPRIDLERIYNALPSLKFAPRKS